MNFYINKDGLEYIDVFVHDKKLILTIKNEKTLYEHSQLWDMIEIITPYFDNNKMHIIEENILFNYRNKNILIPFKPIKKQEGSQFKLF